MVPDDNALVIRKNMYGLLIEPVGKAQSTQRAVLVLMLYVAYALVESTFPLLYRTCECIKGLMCYILYISSTIQRVCTPLACGQCCSSIDMEDRWKDAVPRTTPCAIRRLVGLPIPLVSVLYLLRLKGECGFFITFKVCGRS